MGRFPDQILGVTLPSEHLFILLNFHSGRPNSPLIPVSPPKHLKEFSDLAKSNKADWAIPGHCPKGPASPTDIQYLDRATSPKNPSLLAKA